MNKKEIWTLQCLRKYFTTAWKFRNYQGFVWKDWVARVVFPIQILRIFGGHCSGYFWDIRLKICRLANFYMVFQFVLTKFSKSKKRTREFFAWSLFKFCHRDTSNLDGLCFLPFCLWKLLEPCVSKKKNWSTVWLITYFLYDLFYFVLGTITYGSWTLKILRGTLKITQGSVRLEQ